MMNFPLVSVVMIAFNTEKYIKEAIDSILNQTYENIELVIIDDGSTDNTPKIIEEYLDTRIHYYRNEYNMGIVKSRNRSFECASGQYIGILDSDDIALPQRIEKQVAFLENNPDYGMCSTCYAIIDGNGTFLEKDRLPQNFPDIYISPAKRNAPRSDMDAKSYLMLGNGICNSTTLIRSSLAKEIMYRYEFTLSEDYDFWYRLSKKAKIINLPLCETYYRIHINNTSRKKHELMVEMEKKMNNLILSDLNMDYSKEELEIHSNFLLLNSTYFKDTVHFSGLQKWLLKLYKKMKSEGKYNHKLLYEILAEYWIVICNKTGRNYKIFFSGFLLLDTKTYLSQLAKNFY